MTPKTAQASKTAPTSHLSRPSVSHNHLGGELRRIRKSVAEPEPACTRAGIESSSIFNARCASLLLFRLTI
eukprot:6182709-Pleurochrysis_carterae.AAC.2